MAHEYVSESAYEDRPVAETHPDHLWVAAKMRGIDLPRPETMRVLELGCAHAVNLIPMAFHLPNARFHGVDIASGPIEVARSRIRELGLENLTVECADVMDYEAGDDQYDLIIAHGLFSWVPDDVRTRILALCRAALAPHGIAYISYNAMPAWGIRNGIGRAIQEMVAGVTDPEEQVRRARAGLKVMEKVRPLERTPEGYLVQQELDGLADKPDSYLLHEYLVPARAFWLREFVELAQNEGLDMVGDVAPTGLDPGVFDQAADTLAKIAPDEVGAQQLADIVAFRQFRASILCRSGAPRERVTTDWIREMHLAASPGEYDDAPAWREKLVERWPADVSFHALQELSGEPPDSLASAVLSEHKLERLQLRPRSLPIVNATSGRPRVSAVTRFEAAHLPFVTTPLHHYAPLDGFHAALLALMDGTRTKRELVAGLADAVRDGTLQLGGHVPSSTRKLRDGLAPMVRSSLKLLVSACLVEG